jgi:TPR repeat protein
VFFEFPGFGDSLSPNTEIFRLQYIGGDDLLRKCETFANSLKSTAAEGDTSAQLSIGICLRSGTGISRDPFTAGQCFNLSANEDNFGADLNYWYCLRKCESIGRNVTQAANVFKRLAFQGYPGGQAEYG